MRSRLLLGALALAAAAGAAPLAPPAEAAVLPGTAAAAASAGAQTSGVAIEQVQYYRGGAGAYRYAPRPYPGPRYYAPGPRYYGPPRVWAYRPWYARPYFGTIVAGVALGTIIGVTAYGIAPRPPRPDLCWYWADPSQTSGYWDYC